MSKMLLILMIALVFEASGVVFLSKGLKQIGEVEKVNAAEIARIVKRGATNRFVLIGVLLEAIFFGALLYLLSQSDVSLIWPLTSLGFVLTTISAKLILHEHVSGTRWLGVLLIVAGAGLISWTEKHPGKTATAPPGQNQASARP